MQELANALVKIKFARESDGKTDDELLDHAKTLIAGNDHLLLAMAKAAVLDSMAARVAASDGFTFQGDFAVAVQTEIGREVGRIILDEIERRGSSD